VNVVHNGILEAPLCCCCSAATRPRRAGSLLLLLLLLLLPPPPPPPMPPPLTSLVLLPGFTASKTCSRGHLELPQMPHGRRAVLLQVAHLRLGELVLPLHPVPNLTMHCRSRIINASLQ